MGKIKRGESGNATSMQFDLIYKHYTCNYNTTTLRAVRDLALGKSEQACVIFSMCLVMVLNK